MSSRIVNLNTNPCKMCMPLGAVNAFYGIARCMSLLHGSQGCSTYIRRHMATHYHEPVDIASSSLTEEGTVFGGERNLIRGLDNLIALYRPEVVAVATTCLAETIGEDVQAAVRARRESRPDCRTTVITVSTAGYSGTRYEGWFRALHALVSQTAMDPAPHAGVNVVTGPVSPADTRALKRLLREAGLTFTLLPDISDNLDGGCGGTYSRLPEGGTPLAAIARTAGARATLELATFVPEDASPGRLLEQQYGVPLFRLNLPVGLRDTDAFLTALEELGGTIPAGEYEERARYLDAMVDAHKHNALGRAAVFGEPDLVYGLTRLCCENGLLPAVAAGGADCPALKTALEEEIRPLAENTPSARFSVLNFADFDDIEAAVAENDVNLLIGSSDGRRAAHKHNIPLVRCAFPVHDHLGGQRIRVLGYAGAMRLLDAFANALIGSREASFRTEIYNRHCGGKPFGLFPERLDTGCAEPGSPDARAGALRAVPEKKDGKPGPSVVPAAARAVAGKHREAAVNNADKSATHPCFSASAARTCARIHLPVAPDCNIVCNYCVRGFSCPNENRPGVTAEVLTPPEALERFLRVRERMPALTVAGIAGPGDALANFAATTETLRLIRREDPDITFCLSTNGLLLPLYAAQLADLGVSHVTVTVNAADPAVGARIYRRATYMGMSFQGEAAAAMLISNQLAGLRLLTDAGIVCKANIVLIKGINEDHVEDVVRAVKSAGASVANIMQMIPVRGSAFEHLPLISNREHAALRRRCEKLLPQMHHCRQCRADAAGLLDEDQSYMLRGPVPASGAAPAAEAGCAAEAERAPAQVAVAPRNEVTEHAPVKVAVASRSGIVVDQHFGAAGQFHIYESDGLSTRLLETRRVGGNNLGCGMCGRGPLPEGPEDAEQGGGKIARALEAVADCRIVVVMRIGDSPSRRLAERGIAVFSTYDGIDKAVMDAVLARRDNIVAERARDAETV
ncbi:MAG: nitrogenase cofactor biosynthesis protein NifB [Desulfovibrio sp.]|jgi:nitrogenase cofactor biosynthesis protein NifB|nr:nitrogenase cofactor biosynthesis protein NifB [Desulfovibrio sp.]